MNHHVSYLVVHSAACESFGTTYEPFSTAPEFFWYCMDLYVNHMLLNVYHLVVDNSYLLAHVSHLVVHVNHLSAHRYVEENGLATILTTKRSAPEVNLMECIACMPLPSMNKAAHSGFETQRRCHQMSKTGVSVAPQKGLT